MKSILITVITLTTCLSGIYSQETFTPYSEIGAKAGMSPFNNIYLVGSKETTLFNTTQLGLRFLHVEQKNLGVIFEINYNKAFAEINSKTYTFDYVQTPLMTHFYLPIKEASIGLNVGSYLQFITDRNNSDILLERDLFFGLTGGIGVTIPVKRVSLTIEGRYNHNLFSASRIDYSKLNSWIQFSVAISYRKKWQNRTKYQREQLNTEDSLRAGN
ncbi:MAG: PorT family protein [Cytophagaceae bacterium]|jgi:hypothetical protein|nr:PorT family protein [Cytophagaceae bacterium]